MIIRGNDSIRGGSYITRRELGTLQSMNALIGSVRTADGSGKDPQEIEESSEENENETAATPAPSDLKVWTPEEVSRAEQARYMHVCQGHPSDESLTWLFENGLVLGCALSGRDVRNAHQMLGPCWTCMVGKTRQRSRYSNVDKEPSGRIGEMLYVDIHPLPEKAVGGYTCLLISLDKYSGMIHVVELISKHTSQLITAFKELFSYFKKHGKIENIHTDAEPSFTSLTVWMRSKGIKYKTATGGDHNRPIERHIGTLGQRVRCLKAQTIIELPGYLEGEAWKTAAALLNEMPNARMPTTTPNFMFNSEKLNLTARKMFPFAIIVMVRVVPTQTDGAKMKLAIVLGPSENTYGAHNVYFSSSKRIAAKSDEDIILLQKLPPQLPWTLKLNHKQLSIPLKKIIRRKKGAIKNKPDMVREDAAFQL